MGSIAVSRRHWLTACAALLVLSGTATANSNKSIHLGAGTETGGRSTVNGSITVGQNSTISGSLKTVNGSITIGADCQLRDAETVNGSIRVGANTRIDDIDSVNGTIRIAENAIVEGEISVVNGKISTETGTRVAHDISNVNGEMLIRGTEVNGDISTVSGDLTITDNSVLYGRLTVEKPGGWGWGRSKQRKPRVVIGPGSQVNGGIQLEREVELYISDSASVASVSGEMSMDDAIRFSGERP